MILTFNIYEDPDAPLSDADKDEIQEIMREVLDASDLRCDVSRTDD